LIEGVLSSDVKLINQQGVVSFQMISKRETPEYKETTIRIEAQGKLGETLFKIGRIGRRVRVLGRLENDCLKDGFYINAEHIEFHPEILRGSV
jgi:hypothetical protein